MAGPEQMVAYYKPPETETLRCKTPEKYSEDNVDANKESSKKSFTNTLIQLGEIRLEIEELKDSSQDFTKEQFNALIGYKKEKYQQLASNLHIVVGNDGVAHLKDFDKPTQDELMGELKPESFDILLAMLPSGKVVKGAEKLVVLAEKSPKIQAVITRLSVRVNSIYKEHNIVDSSKDAIIKLIELVKKGNLPILEKMVEKFNVIKEGPKALTEEVRVKLLNEFESAIKDIKKVLGESEGKIEKVVEAESQSIGKLGENIHRLFRGVPAKVEFSKIRDQLFTEIRKFENWEQRNSNIPELRQFKDTYIADFMKMLESHGKDIRSMKTIEDIKKFLLTK